MRAFATPPDMTVSEWADAFRVLSPESSAERGRWRTDRAPYQREIMDSIGDPRVERVVVKSSAQIGKTEVLLNVIGYYMDYDPAPMLYIQPTEDMAESFAKDRLTPMIRDCPTLASKIIDTKDKRRGNTTFHKSFPGGHITMIGANAPSKLASRPIRVLLLDEVDRFPASAGKEGDPIALAVKRTTTFWNRKIIEVSTPTIKGASKIDRDFENSTAEELEYACPECSAFQPFEWAQITGGHHTSEAYAYCRAREDRRIWAIKGRGGSGEAFIQRPKARHKSGCWLFTIGVDVGKDTISSRLKVQFADHPGYCTYPIEADRGYDEAYFEGLTAEHRVIQTVNGRTVIHWKKKTDHARNEAFDLKNYNSAAIEIMNPNLERMEARRLGELDEPVTKPQPKRRLSHGVEIW
mgnify:CR=1 FL=1